MPKAESVGDRVIIYTDGACSGNPGPGGWAAILIHAATGYRREISGAERMTTNNRMEMIGVIEGLKALRRPSEVEVVSDSRYVVQGMNEWIHNWIRRGWRTASKKPVLNEDLWRELLFQSEKQKEVRFTWVQSHAGNPENERCDELAVQAYRELMEND